MFAGLLHILGGPGGLGIPGIDRPGIFVVAGGVESLSRPPDQGAGLELIGGLHMDAVRLAEASPPFQEGVRHIQGIIARGSPPTEVPEDHKIPQAGAPGIVQEPIHEAVVIMGHHGHVVAHRDGDGLLFRGIDGGEDFLGGACGEPHIRLGLPDLKRELIPAWLEGQGSFPARPTDGFGAGMGGEESSLEGFLRQSPGGQRELEMIPALLP